MAGVLVVEKSGELQNVLRVYFRLRKHEVFQARTLPEALDMLSKIEELGFRIAVVCDLSVPGDEASFSAALRAEAPCVRIISFAEEYHADVGIKNLMKPGDFDKLGDAVEELLKT